jgi:hypothetical protein
VHRTKEEQKKKERKKKITIEMKYCAKGNDVYARKRCNFWGDSDLLSHNLWIVVV